jgi:hypothetical protein
MQGFSLGLLYMGYAKFYVYLIWYSNFFFNNLILIQDQLILFFWKYGIEIRGAKIKKTSNIGF